MELTVNEKVNFYPQTKKENIVWEAVIVRINKESIVIKVVITNKNFSFDGEIVIKKVEIPVYISKIEKKSEVGVSLKQRYEAIVNEYVSKFCVKNEYEFENVEIIGDSIVNIGEYYLDFSDVKTDIDSDIPAGYLFKYFDYCYGIYNTNEVNKQFNIKPTIAVNYKNYVKYYLGFNCLKFD